MLAAEPSAAVTGTSPGRELASTLAYLARVLKTPTIGRTWEELADKARASGWSHEEYLATVLQRQSILAIGLGVRAVQAGYPVLFDTATNWISRLTTAHNTGRLKQELKCLRRYKLLVIDEIGYLAFDHDAANLFFQLVAARYEQGSILVTSNMPFGRWGEIFSDDIVAAAMIDRLVHHGEVITLTAASYRTRSRRELLARMSPAATK
ncbi:MAG TPA: ATP-binding protein [Kribbella sp.]|jgi:hypothetical protein